MQVNQLTHLTAPVAVNLEITDKCNLSCTFCFNASPSYEAMMQEQEVQDKASKEMGQLLMNVRKKRILQTLDRLYDAGVFEIRLFGGEFTVFKPWREVLRYAHEKGFFISFVSNGYLIDEDDAVLLSECGVRNCTISVHGLEDVHDSVVQWPGSFIKAMHAIEKLQAQGVVVTVAYTPTATNIHGVFDLVSYLQSEHDVNYFSVSRLFGDDRYEALTLNDYHYLLEVIERCNHELGVEILLADSFPRCKVPVRYWKYLGYCSQGTAFAQVDFNGNLKHCSATSKSLGNVLETDVKKLWDEKLQAMRDLEHLPKSCRICPIFCGGGCTVSRGVDNQFAPDEFIPWPRDENWPQAIIKSVYNRFRKTVHRLQHSQHYEKKATSVELPRKPRLTKRFRIRSEGSHMLVMFENFGTRILSPVAAQVLTLLNGTKTIDVVYDEVTTRFPDVSMKEVEEIVKSFPIE